MVDVGGRVRIGEDDGVIRIGVDKSVDGGVFFVVYSCYCVIVIGCFGMVVGVEG